VSAARVVCALCRSLPGPTHSLRVGILVRVQAEAASITAKALAYRAWSAKRDPAASATATAADLSAAADTAPDVLATMDEWKRSNRLRGTSLPPGKVVKDSYIIKLRQGVTQVRDADFPHRSPVVPWQTTSLRMPRVFAVSI
jgi:hypothetical protein